MIYKHALTDLSIIILNHERYPHLKRLLNFYNTYGLELNIVVLDSSNIKTVDDELTKLLNKENITWKKYDSGNFYEKIALGIECIETKYSVLCPVDDFIVPSALVKCIEFLEKHPDYLCAQGLFIKHWLFQKNSKTKFGWMPRDIRMVSNNFKLSQNRVYAYLSNLSGGHQFYGVHRTEKFKLIWRETVRYASNMGWGEYFPGCLSLIYGKRKVLPVFYLSRETHETLPVTKEDLNLDFINNLLNARKGLAKHFSIENNLSHKIAQEQANWVILAKLRIKLAPKPFVSAIKRIKYMFYINIFFENLKLSLIGGGVFTTLNRIVLFSIRKVILIFPSTLKDKLITNLENRSIQIVRSIYKGIILSRKNSVFQDDYLKIKHAVLKANIDPNVAKDSRLEYTVT